MSTFYRETLRKRWATRRMILKNWYKQPKERIRPREPICQIDADGEVFDVSNDKYDSRDEVWGLYRHFLKEGEEVDTWGELFEYSSSGGVPFGPLEHDAPPRHDYRRRDSYPRIFLQYRRGEGGEAYAARVNEALVNRFGASEVFMAPGSIRGGEVGDWAIQQSVAHCQVVVAVLSPTYVDARDPKGNRRIDSPRDYVKREITAALDRRTRIVPVLLPGATVEAVTAGLPYEMSGLGKYQILSLSEKHWQADIELIATDVAEALK